MENKEFNEALDCLKKTFKEFNDTIINGLKNINCDLEEIDKTLKVIVAGRAANAKLN